MITIKQLKLISERIEIARQTGLNLEYDEAQLNKYICDTIVTSVNYNPTGEQYEAILNEFIELTDYKEEQDHIVIDGTNYIIPGFEERKAITEISIGNILKMQNDYDKAVWLLTAMLCDSPITTHNQDFAERVWTLPAKDILATFNHLKKKGENFMKFGQQYTRIAPLLTEQNIITLHKKRLAISGISEQVCTSYLTKILKRIKIYYKVKCMKFYLLCVLLWNGIKLRYNLEVQYNRILRTRNLK